MTDDANHPAYPTISRRERKKRDTRRRILDAAMQLMSDKPYDEVRIEGSPTLRVRATGGYHGDIATASIVVNSLPKVIAAAPGLYAALAALPA